MSVESGKICCGAERMNNGGKPVSCLASFRGGIVAALSLSLAAGDSVAQMVIGPRPEAPEWEIIAEQTLGVGLNADLGGPLSGEVKTVVSDTALSVAKTYQDSVATFSLGYGLRRYDWSDQALVEQSHAFSVGLRFQHAFDGGDWGIFGRTSLTFEGEFEQGALLDGRTWLIALAPSYQVNRNLFLALGLGVVQSPARDLRLIPFGSIRWQISDRWSLSTAQGATLNYRLKDDSNWWAKVVAHVESSGLRARSRQLPGDSGQAGYVLEDFGVRVGAGIDYLPREAVFLRTEVGATVYREFSVRRLDAKVFDATADPSAYFRVSAGLRF